MIRPPDLFNFVGRNIRLQPLVNLVCNRFQNSHLLYLANLVYGHQLDAVSILVNRHGLSQRIVPKLRKLLRISLALLDLLTYYCAVENLRNHVGLEVVVDKEPLLS